MSFNLSDFAIILTGIEIETAPNLDFDIDEARLTEAEKERKLVCVRCGKFITYSDEAIKIMGHHRHTRTNPHGLTFLFGCFRSAQGCVHIDDEIEEFTWFAGFKWCGAHCGNCKEHLGWQFRNKHKQFHGLILDKLTRPSP
jgi:hypothetical protein